MKNQVRGGQLDHDALEKAVVSTLDHLAKVAPGSRDDLLQVLAHILAAALKDKPPSYVTAYFMKITQMLDGRFDR